VKELKVFGQVIYLRHVSKKKLPYMRYAKEKKSTRAIEVTLT
jgi:hypothetical protein